MFTSSVRYVCAVAALSSLIGLHPAPVFRAHAQSASPVRQHGPYNAITDVDGIRVGQYQKADDGFLTGTTVVWAAEGGAMGAAYVPGGWPGGINTDVLQVGKNEMKIDVAFLTGGSSYGLKAFSGIIDWLEQHRSGTVMGATPDHVLPLVSGAVVYDLNAGGRFDARPDETFGRLAISSAVKGPVAQGNVGAGTGTASGVFRLKGGLGTASEVFGGFQVGIITAINAAGTPVDLTDCSLRGTGDNLQGEFDRYRIPTVADCTAAKTARKIAAIPSAIEQGRLYAAARNDLSHPQTTISVIATNATLTREQLYRLAQDVNAGQAQVIIPFNTRGDGDSLFAMATGTRAGAVTDVQFQQLLRVARSVAGRAIAHAMLSATGARGLQSYCTALPSACVR